MKQRKESVDVLVAGGGTAGHVAALQAARAGARTSIIEAGTMLGGTMTLSRTLRNLSSATATAMANPQRNACQRMSGTTYQRLRL